MMYHTVAEFAAKEVELHERLMKIGLMHNIPMMSFGEKPNLKSKMKYLAFMPRNSEQGVEGNSKLEGHTKNKGQQRNFTERVKNSAKKPGQTRKKGKARKSCNEAQVTAKDQIPGKSSSNSNSRQSHVTKTSGSERRTTVKLKETDKQGENPRSFVGEMATMTSTESADKRKTGTSKEWGKIRLLVKVGSHTVRARSKKGKRHRSSFENRAEAWSSVESNQPMTSKKDKKVKRKSKAPLSSKKRMNSEDSDGQLIEIVEDLQRLSGKPQDNAISCTKRKSFSKAVSPVHSAQSLAIQSEEDGLRFNASFIRRFEEGELLKTNSPNRSPSPFSKNIFKADKELYTAVRECFNIYRRLDGRGFKIPLKTLQRGLMTPTEMRILEEIRKASRISRGSISATSNTSPQCKRFNREQ